MSTTPNAICNFLSLGDVSRAVPDESESQFHDAECSFIIKAHKQDEAGATSELDRLSPASYNPPGFATVAALGKSSCDNTSRNKVDIETRLGPKPYFFKASSIAERDQWVSAINSAVRDYQREKAYEECRKKSAFRRLQSRLRSVYTSLRFQFVTALMVAVNFFLTVSSNRADPGFALLRLTCSVLAVVAVTSAFLCTVPAAAVLQHRRHCLHLSLHSGAVSQHGSPPLPTLRPRLVELVRHGAQPGRKRGARPRAR